MMRPTLGLMLTIVVLAVMPLAACGNPYSQPGPDSTPTPLISGQANISISNFAFSPQTVRVTRGTTITWTNKDSFAHTVTSNDNLFTSSILSPGATFQYTSNQTGTFDYYCGTHPYMKAKIIVE